jgi:hypothetical protein
MKYLFLLTFSLSIICLSAQTNEQKLFPLNTYINNKNALLSEDAVSMLSNKINVITSNQGIGGENPSNPRFLLYSKLIVNKKNVVAGTSTGITINADVYFYVGDAFDKTIFSSQIVAIKGYGNTEEAALIDAIRTINPNDEKYKKFIQTGVAKINQYFVTQCPILISKAKALASEQKYDEAIYNLYNIPEASASCYPEAHDLINKIYQSKANDESAKNLKKARLIWSGAQTSAAVNEILPLLNKVNPISTSFREVDPFLNEISKKVENNIIRDFQERQEIRKQQLEKDKIQLELDKQQIQASKEIAVAYASRTYISNNYTSNSYSSSYYATRIYDTLIW